VEGMYGETKNAYLDHLAQHGKDFKISTYKANLGEFIKKLKPRLYAKAGEDLTSEHLPAVMSEIFGAGKDKDGKPIKGKTDWLKTKDMKEFENPLFRSDITNLIRHYYDTKGDISRDVVEGTEYISKYLGKEPKVVYMHQKDKAA
jgi:hypothetical protein